MSARRILLAGVLGGIAMFLWSAVAHMATPLATTGVSEIPNEAAVLKELQGSIGHANGFYFFPGTGLPADATSAQKQEAMRDSQKRLDASPSGILIYHPPGRQGITPTRLGRELGIEIVESLLLAFLLSLTTLRTMGSRVGFALLVGVTAAITTNMPYWNWYGFPKSYTVAYMTIEIVAYLVSGIVIALVAGRGTSRASGAAA